MKAVIVAGGEGTRLRPLTNDIPKAMLEINGKPVLQHQIEWLKRFGLEDILVTVGYKHDKIMDYFGDGSKFGVKLTYFIEEKPLGNAGAFLDKDAQKFMDNTTLIVFGDILTNLNIFEFLAFHCQRQSKMTILLRKQENMTDILDDVRIDDNNRITYFQEKPKEVEELSHNNCSVYLADKAYITGVMNDIYTGVAFQPYTGVANPDTTRIVIDKLDFSKDIFPLLARKNQPFYGFASDRVWWREVGNIEKMDAISREPDKAVFLDIDGVLCKKAKLGEYIDSIDKFEWLDGAKEAIRELAMKGFYIFLHTNKASINKGMVSEVQIKDMYNMVFNNLPIQEAFVCPHRSDETCSCRKPKSGLIEKGLLKYNIKPSRCWVVGDNDVDIVAGENVGCKTILVGNDGFRKLEIHPNFVARDIVDVVNIITKR